MISVLRTFAMPLLGLITTLTLALLVVFLPHYYAGGTSSVEVGLQESSTVHNVVGYAVPASGCSDPNGCDRCVLQFNTNPIDQGADTKFDITLIPSSGSYQDAYWVHRCSLVEHTRAECDASHEAPPGDANHYDYWDNVYGGSGTLGTAPNGRSAKTSSLPPGNYLYRLAVRFNTHSGYVAARCQRILEVGNSNTVGIEVSTPDTPRTSNDITIDPGEQITLYWNSEKFSKCDGVNFTTGGATDGQTDAVTEPTAGNTKTYTVNCSSPSGGGANAGPGPSANASLNVTMTNYGTIDLTADPNFVHKGETTDLTWNIKDNPPASCTLNGPGIPSGTTLDKVNKPYSVAIYGVSTFTLTCPGGTDTATVRILPVIQET